jgi:diaminohydroxyphosphoribosylaminopyrimidine deaminase/5-amino-6-(5-phosphoribosylamino)uracil reductase
MRRALELGATSRSSTSPNPWVGCVLLGPDGTVAGEGATAPPPGPHAEAAALAAAGGRGRGGTAYVTLEPCSHYGRTPPCVDALVAAGIRRVVIGTTDPDPRESGHGIGRLREAGVEVVAGLLAAEVSAQLRPYIVQRTTGRPYVILKLAATLDGRLAAPDGSSKWITGSEARADVQRLRAESDAILVGAGTVRADDPELTVRTEPAPARQPLRVVLGKAPTGARVLPALELSGDLRGALDELGRRGILQLLVEGGAHVAGELHRLGLVDRYVVYLAPALLGGDDGVAMFAGEGSPTMDEAWRGRFVEVRPLGDDLRLDLEPAAGIVPS